MKILIDVPEGKYNAVKKAKELSMGLGLMDKAILNGTIIPDHATRKDVHLTLFGIRPPELDSPYCACAVRCAECEHKDDINCDVNWWNEEWRGN